MQVIVIKEDGDHNMSINRMSFNETNILNSLGFAVRLKIDYIDMHNELIIRKGSLVFGFKDIESAEDTYGYLFNTDFITQLPNAPILYITMSKSGNIDILPGDTSKLRGLAANIPGIPWYTFEGNALIGKIFSNKQGGFIESFIVCDDAYWCEFEGMIDGVMP